MLYGRIQIKSSEKLSICQMKQRWKLPKKIVEFIHLFFFLDIFKPVKWCNKKSDASVVCCVAQGVNEATSHF